MKGVVSGLAQKLYLTEQKSTPGTTFLFAA